MTTEDLHSCGAIYFANIREGFEKYKHQTVKLNRQAAVNMIMSEIKQGSQGYIDFYYYKLEDEAREKVDEMLDEDEREYLEELSKQVEDKETDIVFELTEELLDIVTRLNEMETLFSTIYLVGNTRSTWCGNYNGEYVIFTE